jgi:hypothetical protein
MSSTPSTPPQKTPPPITPIKKKRKKSKMKFWKDLDKKGKEVLKRMGTDQELTSVELDNEMFKLRRHEEYFDWVLFK